MRPAVQGAGDPAPPVSLSVVVPVFGCRECLEELHRRLAQTLERLVPSFEIVLVNDGSPDGAWDSIRELAARDARVRGVDLSRNFGQHQAIAAGLDRARGAWTVVMDCDLQHPPEEIGPLYRAALQGHDIVIGRRLVRRDPATRRSASRVFSWFYGLLTGRPYDSRISNFSIASRRALAAVQRLRERDRAHTTLLYWVGFDPVTVDFAHADRFAGRTSYSPRRLVRFAIESIASEPLRPLRAFAGLGVLLASASALTAVGLGVARLAGGVGVPGWALLLVSMWLLGGLLLVNVGVLGLFVGKAFEQAKGRPLYVVRRTVNMDIQVVEEDTQDEQDGVPETH